MVYLENIFRVYLERSNTEYFIMLFKHQRLHHRLEDGEPIMHILYSTVA